MEQGTAIGSNIEGILRKIQQDQSIIGKTNDFMKFVDERGFRPGLRVLRNLQEELNGFFKKMLNVLQFGFKQVLDMLAKLVEAIKGLRFETKGGAVGKTLNNVSVIVKMANENKIKPLDSKTAKEAPSSDYNIFEKLTALYQKLRELQKQIFKPILDVKDLLTDKLKMLRDKLKAFNQEKHEFGLKIRPVNPSPVMRILLLTVLDILKELQSKMVLRADFDMTGMGMSKLHSVHNELKLLPERVNLPIAVSAEKALVPIENVNTRLTHLGKVEARPSIMVNNNSIKAMLLEKLGNRIIQHVINTSVNVHDDKAVKRVHSLGQMLGKLGKMAVSPVIAVKNMASKAISFGGGIAKAGLGVVNAGLGLLGIDPNQSVKDVLKNDAGKGAQYAVSINNSIASIRQSFEKPFNSFIRQMLQGLAPLLQSFAGWLKNNQGVMDSWASKGAGAFGVIIKAVKAIVSAVAIYWPLIQSTITSGWNNLKPVFGVILSLINKLIFWVVTNIPMFAAAFDSVFPTVCKIIKTVIGYVDKLWQIWMLAWPTISDILQTAWTILEPIISLILTSIDLLGTVFVRVFPIILNVIQSFWNVLKPLYEKIGGIISILANGLDKFKNFLSGEKNVDVNLKTNGKHAAGLSYVPFDGYVAELHKGERVLTASENKSYGKPGKTVSNSNTATTTGNTFNITINGINKSTNEIMNELITRIKEAAGTMGEVAFGQ